VKKRGQDKKTASPSRQSSASSSTHPKKKHSSAVKLNLLWPRFPPEVVAEVTQMSGARSRAQLEKNCIAGQIDSVLVNTAVAIAQEHFKAVRSLYQDSPPNTYPIENAVLVALLALDGGTPTRAESVLASLFEQTIAHFPGKAMEMQRELTEALRKKKFLTPDRESAIATAFELGDQVARFSRVPRLYAENPDLPQQVFLDAQEMALASSDPRMVPLKLCEAMNRLRTLGGDPRYRDALENLAMREKGVKSKKISSQEEREVEAILAIAENLYVPLAKAIGWKGAAAKIEDYIFAYRQPAERERMRLEGEKLMGEGFFANGREFAAELTQFVTLVLKTKFSEDSFSVKSRAKQLSSVSAKIKKKNYKDITEVPDLLGCRIVFKGNNVQACMEALAILKRAFDFDASQTTDHIYCDSEKRPGYESIHLVGKLKEQLSRRLGLININIPSALLGKSIEVQVRDDVMDREAEVGEAIHLGYKMRFKPPKTYRKRTEQVRSDLAYARAGMAMLAEPPEDIFVVRANGVPQRIPNDPVRGVCLLDALVALDPGYVYAASVTINGVERADTKKMGAKKKSRATPCDGLTVDLNTEAAREIRIKNGDSLVVQGFDMARRPNPAWMDVIRTPTAEIVLRGLICSL